MTQDTPKSKIIRGRRRASGYAAIGSTQSWLLEKQGRFPKPIALGPRSRGWLVSELDAWIEARAAERDAATQ